MARPPIACSLSAADLRERRAGLLAALTGAVRRREERPDGVVFRLDGSESNLQLAAEVIRFERRCCGFLRFALTVEPDEGPIGLEITGPEGTREFLQDLLPEVGPGASPRDW